MRTRFAPTPSGFLHIGNALNLLMCQRVANERQLELGLRIDDFDSFRVRPEYIEDIFDLLDWLEIDLDFGPANSVDFQQKFSFVHQEQELRNFVFSLDHPDLFICTCSRTSLVDQKCVAGCAVNRYDFSKGQNALRMSLPEYLADHGDVVLWRREDLPAYHLASVVSDNQLGITTVVRGVDLLASSKLHKYLADIFNLASAQQIEYLHHELIRSGDEKLSKSQNAPALVRNEQTKQQLFELTKTFELF